MKKIYQHDRRDCGIACIATISNYFGYNLPLIYIRDMAYIDKNGLTLYGMINVLHKLYFEAEALYGTINELENELFKKNINYPFIAHIKNDSSDDSLDHYVVIKKIKNNKIKIFDPAKGNINFKKDEFIKIWSGYIVIVKPTSNLEKHKKTINYKKKYFDIIYKNKFTFLNLLVLSVLILILSLYGSLLYQKIIDNYILNNNSNRNLINIFYNINLNNFFKDNIHIVFIILLFIYLSTNILNVAKTISFERLSKKLSIIIKEMFVIKFINLPLSYFNDRDAGEILSRYNSIDLITDTLTNAGITILLEVFTLISSGIILYVISPLLFLIVLGIALIYIITMLIFKDPINKLNENLMEEDSKLSSLLKESLDGLETIKSICNETITQNKLVNMIKKYSNYIFERNIFLLIVSSIISSVESLSYIIILFIGSQMVINGTLTLGTLLVFESLINYFLQPLKSLVNMQPTLQESIIAIRRLDDVLESQIEYTNHFLKKDNKKSIINGNINITNLNYSYGFVSPSLININLEISNGEKVIIVGDSGSGKSTLAKLLTRLYPAPDNTIYINNNDINMIDAKQLRKQVSYVPQNSFLFSGTIKENITINNSDIEEKKFNDIIYDCKIDNILNNRDINLNSIISENGKNLSGGERQRIALARALSTSSDIYIFDEATNQLDKKSELEIMEYVWRILEDKTCISIMHDLNLLKKADKIVVMSNKQIIGVGKHEELIYSNDIYRNLLKKQLQSVDY